MNNPKILWQLQLSCYDSNGKFTFTADSNWQIFITKARELFKLNPNIEIDVLVPERKAWGEDIRDLLGANLPGANVAEIQIPIQANAVATRYDFPMLEIKACINSCRPLEEYTHVYINDPMLMRHYKSMFMLSKLNVKPMFILQTHFLDSPVDQIVPEHFSYWHGTVEGVSKADVALWHCDSMLKVFKKALSMDYTQKVSDSLLEKCAVWKDGYSISEIREPVKMSNVRFNLDTLKGKTIVWVPNRVGGLGMSFDYTNNGAFLFEKIPQLWKQRQDFVVVAGNPNQKIPNDVIAEKCPAYVKLVPGALNRDEYRLLSERADIVVGLYTNDTNGGLASLESIEFGAVPLFPDVFEYKHYFDAVNWPSDKRVNPSLNNLNEVLSKLIDDVRIGRLLEKSHQLREYVRHYAAYEHTTKNFAIAFGLV